MISLAFKFASGRFRNPLLYPLSHRGAWRHAELENAYTNFGRPTRIFEGRFWIVDGGAR
jgi:hypothetical protein